MSIAEIMSKYGLETCVVVFVLMTLVEISPIKLNPLGTLAKVIGRALNKEMIDQLNEIKKEVRTMDQRIEKLDYRVDESNAIQARSRILRFGDEVSHGQNHSRDHFQQIFVDITNYDAFCRDNPDFKNNMTKITAKRIEDDYMERDKDNNFL